MPQFTQHVRDVRAISELLPYYTKTADTPETLLVAAHQWHTLGFCADDDLPNWLATGWLDPHVAHAAKAAGLNPKTATQAAEHALAGHYLAWWESDANPPRHLYLRRIWRSLGHLYCRDVPIHPVPEANQLLLL